MSNLVLTNNGKIVKRNNLGAFPAWSSFIDELFNDNILDTRANLTGLPKVNIKETDEAYTMEMAVPGYSKNDFIVDVVNDELSISADITTNKEEEVNGYTRREFGIESFKRTFTLPETVNDDAIKASYTEGILTLEIPKKEEAKPKAPRTIEIS
jgi:HSP20 family protein